MEIIIIVLIGIIFTLLFIIKNMLRKYELLESEVELYDIFLERVYMKLKTSYDRMKKVDRIGAFQSDDETGVIFSEIKLAMEEINDELNLEDGSQEKE
jgi:hypothetical protein